MNLWADLSFGARMLWKRPGMTIAALLTLALGIGASSAVLTLIHSVILTPLPYSDPGRLVRVYESLPQFGWPQFSFSWPDYKDFRDRNRSFEEVAAYVPSSFSFAQRDTPEVIHGAAVTSSFWHLLGVTPSLGRTFLPDEDRVGDGAPVVILSDAVWARLFSRAPDVVGKNVIINNKPYQVIGVLKQEFHLHNNEEVWVPLGPDTPDKQRGNHGTTVFARLRKGVSLNSAASEATALAAQIAHQEAGDEDLRDIVLVTFNDWLVGADFRRALWLLAGAVGFVLLIAYSNVANLLLARAADRRREMAVRLALGATVGRLVRQLLVESSLIAALGGALGIVVGYWCIEGLKAFGGGRIPRLDQVALDSTIYIATFLLALICGIIFGAAPALRAARSNVQENLRTAGRSDSAGRGRDTLRSFLVVNEVALSLILFVGAGLLIRSYWIVANKTPGFESQNLVAARLNLPETHFTNRTESMGALNRLLERLHALPGVQNAAYADYVPFHEGVVSMEILFPGRAVTSSVAPSSDYRNVSAGFLETLGVPLLSGRTISAQDVAESRLVAVVSREFARLYFPDRDPLGQQFHPGGDAKDPPVTIVGVVGDAANSALENKPGAMMYFAGGQFTRFRATSLLVRGTAPASQVAGAIREAVHTEDPAIAVSNIQQMDAMVSASLTGRRFNLLLLDAFAGLAVMLAAVGVFGVMSYGVSQRTQEFGIRMALGAQRKDILQLTFSYGAKLVATGLVIGLSGALALTRLMSTMLYGINAQDPWTFLSVSIFFAAVAALACWIPARRASSVDPNICLKYE